MAIVSLISMSDEEAGAYIDQVIRKFADQGVRSRTWEAASAQAAARRAVALLLPKGPATEGQFFRWIREVRTGINVGSLWFAVRDSPTGREGLGLDLEIEPSHRRRGLAMDALQRMESTLRDAGVRRISVQVFGDNHPSMALASKSRYVLTSTLWTKEIDPLVPGLESN